MQSLTAGERERELSIAIAAVQQFEGQTGENGRLFTSIRVLARAFKLNSISQGMTVGTRIKEKLAFPSREVHIDGRERAVPAGADAGKNIFFNFDLASSSSYSHFK